MSKSVARILEDRRRMTKINLEKSISKVYADYPKLKKIDNEIKALNLDMFNKVLSGENTQKILNEIKKLERERLLLLEKNNIDLAFDQEKHYCSKCEDKGYIKGKSCSCRERLKIDKLYDKSSIESRLNKENFEKFNWELFRKNRMPDEDLSPYENMREIYSDMIYYTDNFTRKSPNLYFFGSVGTGKTFMINSIAKKLLDSQHSVLYQSSQELVDYLAEYTFMYSEDKKINREKVEYIYNVDLLIIDDMGTELINELTKANLFEVINKRLVSGLPTIISSNIAPYLLDEYYDARIYSRIMGEYEPYKFYGNDLRLSGFY